MGGKDYFPFDFLGTFFFSFNDNVKRLSLIQPKDNVTTPVILLLAFFFKDNENIVFNST
jgi:hypothetical protein